MINKFTGQNGFLHNRHRCSVLFNNVEYQSVHHAYSTVQRYMAERGRDDWQVVKTLVMRDLIFGKFIVNQRLSLAILATRPHVLAYENMEDDTFWGTRGGIGENRLGLLLMEIRDRLWEVKSNREMLGVFDVPRKKVRVQDRSRAPFKA